MQVEDTAPAKGNTEVHASAAVATDPVNTVPDVASDLITAARVIEKAAIALAGEVSGGQVTHLLLLSQQLDRISKTLTSKKIA